MSEEKIIKLDLLQIADMFIKKNELIKVCESDIIEKKKEVKTILKQIKELEPPERHPDCSDEEFKKICVAVNWINTAALNKKHWEALQLITFIRKEKKRHNKEKKQLELFIKEKSTEIRKYLLDNNIL